MEPVKIDEIISWCGGSCLRRGISQKVSAISTDSRRECKDALFVPLKGENFDGNDFIKNAIENGAVAFLTENDNDLASIDDDITCIKVGNTLEAFQKIASAYRSHFNIKVVAVTGSNGKTTTKDFVRAILSSKYTTVATEGTKNNHIGVPETVFRLTSDTQAAVFELGMSGFGEIHNLAQIVSPDVGIITNVSYVHTEFFKSLNEVAEAKSELLDLLPRNGFAILNADDAFFPFFSDKARSKIISFGIMNKADVSARNIQFKENMLEFDVSTKNDESKCNIRSAGRHNVYNALASIAVGIALDIPVKDACVSLSKVSLSPMRFEFEQVAGINIINDAYNANPVSTVASIDTFDNIEAHRHRILVLGDMLELGWYAEKGHKEVGERVAKSKSDFLITVGKLAEVIGITASKSGFTGQIINTINAEQAANALSKITGEGDIILVKGSRALMLEKAIKLLKKNKIAGFV